MPLNDVNNWTEEDLFSYLTHNGMFKEAVLLKEKQLNGRTFLLLDEEILKEEFPGISILKRKALLALIDELKKSSVPKDTDGEENINARNIWSLLSSNGKSVNSYYYYIVTYPRLFAFFNKDPEVQKAFAYTRGRDGGYSFLEYIALFTLPNTYFTYHFYQWFGSPFLSVFFLLLFLATDIIMLHVGHSFQSEIGQFLQWVNLLSKARLGAEVLGAKFVEVGLKCFQLASLEFGMYLLFCILNFIMPQFLITPWFIVSMICVPVFKTFIYVGILIEIEQLLAKSRLGGAM